MAHWYQLKPWELEDLTMGEVAELLDRLRRTPPIGGHLQYEQQKRK